MSRALLLRCLVSLCLAAACKTESSSTSNGGAPGQTTSDATSASTGLTTAPSSTVATTSNVTTASATSDASSSSSGGGAGPCDLFQPFAPSQADCAGYCEVLGAEACPNDPTVAECTAACVEEVAYYAPDCEAETVTYLDCLKTSGTVACNADGNAVASGCALEKHAFRACTACVAIPTTSECGCCEVTSCCIQVAELLENDDFDAYAACRTACGPNPGCWSGCDAMYPETGADFDQYNFCINGPCGGPCFGD